MESITALVAICAAFGLSFYFGRSITASSLLVALGGAATGAAFTLLYFVLTVTAGHVLPGFFDAWVLGVHFIGLSIVAPIGSAMTAIFAHRHAERVDAARLPF